MRKLIRSHASWTAVAAVASYVSLAYFLDDNVLKLFFRGMALGVAMVVTTTWAGAAWRAFRSGGDTPEEQIIIAVFATWLSIVMSQMYAALYYMLKSPSWLTQSQVSGFLAMVVCIAGYLFITAPGTSKGAVEGRWKLQVAVAVILGVLVSTFMLGILGEYTIGVEASIVTGANPG